MQQSSTSGAALSHSLQPLLVPLASFLLVVCH
jgi:hypothetical protein